MEWGIPGLVSPRVGVWAYGADLATTGMRGGGVGDSGAREHRNGDGRIGSLGVGMRGHRLGTAVGWGTCSPTDVGVAFRGR